MAKAKNTNNKQIVLYEAKAVNKQANKPKNKGKKQKSKGSGMTRCQQMLADPCNAPPRSYYGGEQGIVQRFVQDITLNTTVGFTSGYLVFAPGANVYVYGGNAASSTAVAPGAFVGPANTWLATAASKLRAVAGCVTTIPSAVSVTNMTGEIAMGIVAYNQLSTTGSYSTDSVFQLTNHRSVLAKKEYETKWYPGMLDSSYGGVYDAGGFLGTANLVDPADNNAILIAWRGYPAGAALSFRLTNIVEWTPRAGLGISVTSAPAIPQNVQVQAAIMHEKKPSWWHTAFEGIDHALAKAGNKLAHIGIERGMEYALEAAAAGA